MHRTALIFWTVIVLSIASAGLLRSDHALRYPVLLLAVVLNAWSIAKSERDAFVCSRQLRRAYEPARHFTPGQVLVVLVSTKVLFGLGTYVLLTWRPRRRT
jgi:hypothetical protein